MSDPPLHAWRRTNGVRDVTTVKRVVQKNEPWLSASQRSSIKLGAKLKRRDIKEKKAAGAFSLPPMVYSG
ncbi:hypothetical protein BHM03_00043651 [Ensete ventricosum]|nr:hypothetical protein BHM03_00043651 [Ensete ventricosum]